MRIFSLLFMIFALLFSASAQKEVVTKNMKAIKTNGKIEAFHKKVGIASKDASVGVPIGITGYDLQSNSAVSKRMINYGDNVLSAVWLEDQEDPDGGSNRGTGYAHKDGTDWNFVSMSGNEHVDNIRTGWPTLMTDGTVEFVANHYNSAGGLFGWYQNIGAAGSGWTRSDLAGSEPFLWPRASSAGSNFYVIGTGDTDANSFIGPELYFIKSADAGTTWSTPVVLPDVATHFNNVSGDSYAIDARDDYVAVIYFGEYGDLLLWKSDDNGDNWTKTVINDFPVDAYDGTAGSVIDMDGDNLADSIMTTDGTGDLIIDSNGKVHVVFSRMRVIDEDASDDGASSYFPYTDWLMYWNEDMGAGTFTGVESPSYVNLAISEQVDTIGWMPDLNDDGDLNFVDAGSELPFGKYYTSLSTFASIGINADDKLFVVYSTVMEGDDYAKTDATPAAQQFRGAYITTRDAETGVWTDPQNVSDVDGTNAENVFPTVAKNVDDNLVHFWLQWDNEPGLHIRGDEDAATENYIVYKTINTSTGVSDIVSDIKVSIFPNPATDIITVYALNLNKIEIYNILGGKVLTVNDNEVNISKLSAGTYLIKVYTKNGVVTKKIQKN